MKNLVASLTLFLIVLSSANAQPAQVTYAASYLNITRPGGGPVVTGDVLEIRNVISVSNKPANITITRVRFDDIVPAGTTYIAGSMKAITNEGLIIGAIPNTGAYTDAVGDDRAQILAGAMHVNVGTGALNTIAAADGGTITNNTTKPTVYNSTCIIVVAYRVTVTGLSGTTITFSPGVTPATFKFRTSLPTVDWSVNVPSTVILVRPSLSCSGLGVTNFITDETNGTFSLGTLQNRAASANVTGYTNVVVGASAPQDGEYSVLKNSSPTQYVGGAPLATDKIFGLTDIFGDHTGTMTGAGNPPAAAGVSGGYMLMVNASLAPNTVFTTNVVGLTINTTYTFSFWIRSQCPGCAADPATGGAAIPAAPGVKANLSFSVNGNIWYTTGEIAYSGLWEQKSFTFNSGALTTATVAIKNNAPGGGGNDWSIDDISILECLVLLPQSLKNFNAKEFNDQVLLNWETGTESNLDRFEIQYSNDGVSYRAVGNVKAAGHPNAYAFTDKQPVSGTSYYRIRMIDKAGAYSFSSVTILRAASAIRRPLQITPNPSRGYPMLNVHADRDEDVTVQVTDLNGRIVVSFEQTIRKGSNSFSIPSNYRPTTGMYTVTVRGSAYVLRDRMIVVD